MIYLAICYPPKPSILLLCWFQPGPIPLWCFAWPFAIPKDFYGLLLAALMVLPHNILVIYLKIGYGFLCYYSVIPHQFLSQPMLCQAGISMFSTNVFHGISGSTHAFPIGFLPLPMLFFWSCNKLPTFRFFLFEPCAHNMGL